MFQKVTLDLFFFFGFFQDCDPMINRHHEAKKTIWQNMFCSLFPGTEQANPSKMSYNWGPCQKRWFTAGR